MAKSKFGEQVTTTTVNGVTTTIKMNLWSDGSVTWDHVIVQEYGRQPKYHYPVVDKPYSV